MAITFVGAFVNPVDGGANEATPVAITPTGMVANDLIVMFSQERDTLGAGAPHSINQAGGQTWTTLAQSQNTSDPIITERIFYATFNGTWSADPAVNCIGGFACSVYGVVFRPTNSTKIWGIDHAKRTSSFAKPTVGVPDSTIPGMSTVHDSTVVIAAWYTDNDNGWSNLQGDGWSSFANQYSNVGGAGQCATFAYRLPTSSSVIADVSKRQNASTRVNGLGVLIAFYEANPEIVLLGGTLLGGQIGV